MVTHVYYLRMLRKDDSESEASLGYIHSETASETNRKGRWYKDSVAEAFVTKSAHQSLIPRTWVERIEANCSPVFRHALDVSSPNTCSKKKRQTKILPPQSFMGPVSDSIQKQLILTFSSTITYCFAVALGLFFLVSQSVCHLFFLHGCQVAQ